MIPPHARNLALALAAGLGVFLIVDGVLALVGLGASGMATGFAGLCGLAGFALAGRVLRRSEGPGA